MAKAFCAFYATLYNFQPMSPTRSATDKSAATETCLRDGALTSLTEEEIDSLSQPICSEEFAMANWVKL